MVRTLILAAALALTACQAPRAGFCAVSEPIRLSQAAIDVMSDAEVAKALEHNRLGAKLCGWRP